LILPENLPSWELRTMVEQHAQLAHLHEDRPLDVPVIRKFFETLLPGAGEAIRGMMIGKVGRAQSAQFKWKLALGEDGVPPENLRRRGT
jgi:hypothetical protein